MYTWNAASGQPRRADVAQLLGFENFAQVPAIVAVGLQEVDMSFKSLVMGDGTKCCRAGPPHSCLAPFGWAPALSCLAPCCTCSRRPLPARSVQRWESLLADHLSTFGHKLVKSAAMVTCYLLPACTVDEPPGWCELCIRSHPVSIIPLRGVFTSLSSLASVTA